MNQKLSQRSYARTLAVMTLLGAAGLLGAPSLARVGLPPPGVCGSVSPTPVGKPVVIKLVSGVPQASDVTIDPNNEEVHWYCFDCSGRHWAVIFKTNTPFRDFLYHDGDHESGCVVIPQTSADQPFGYTVFVGNKSVDPQVIIKGTGIQGLGAKEKGKE
jgi:hypothetical protein